MLISDLHSSKLIGCGGELNQSECLYIGQKGMEGVEGAECAEGAEGTKDMEGTEGMTYIGGTVICCGGDLANQSAYI